MIHEHGKSDRLIVPEKPSDKDDNSKSSAERVEERSLTKGNSHQQNSRRTQRRGRLQRALKRIRQAAVGDRKLRFIRHIKKWLKAGMLEEGRLMQTDEGTPQGGSISPLLANIYLHYAFDLWASNGVIDIPKAI